MQNENDVLKFLEIYSKTMDAENKYVSDMCWTAFKLIKSLNIELRNLESHVTHLEEKENGSKRKN